MLSTLLYTVSKVTTGVYVLAYIIVITGVYVLAYIIVITGVYVSKLVAVCSNFTQSQKCSLYGDKRDLIQMEKRPTVSKVLSLR